MHKHAHAVAQAQEYKVNPEAYASTMVTMPLSVSGTYNSVKLGVGFCHILDIPQCKIGRGILPYLGHITM